MIDSAVYGDEMRFGESALAVPDRKIDFRPERLAENVDKRSLGAAHVTNDIYTRADAVFLCAKVRFRRIAYYGLRPAAARIRPSVKMRL